MWVADPTNYPTKPSVVDDVIAAVCFGALHITNSKMLIPRQLDDSSVGRGAQDAKDLASPHNLLIHLPPRPAPLIFTQSTKGWNWSECTLACYLQSPVCLSVSNLPEGNKTKQNSSILCKLFPSKV